MRTNSNLCVCFANIFHALLPKIHVRMRADVWLCVGASVVVCVRMGGAQPFYFVAVNCNGKLYGLNDLGRSSPGLLLRLVVPVTMCVCVWKGVNVFQITCQCETPHNQRCAVCVYAAVNDDHDDVYLLCARELSRGQWCLIYTNIILYSCLDRILREHRAVKLHGRQAQMLSNFSVLDLDCLFDIHSLDPFCGKRATSNRRSAPKRLEDGFLNLAVLTNLNLKLHHVATGGRSHQTCPKQQHQQ